MAERFTYEKIVGNADHRPDHFRITDTIGDNRVATCYEEANARLVVELMNRGLLSHAPAPAEPGLPGEESS